MGMRMDEKIENGSEIEEEKRRTGRKGCISCPLLYVRIGCRRMQ
jgi:hypothetical protein